MPYTPILATLGYVLSPDRKRVLMIHRNARGDDHHLGKYNGLGGKLETDEDVVAGMRREIHEEAGIDCTELSLRGTISWPGFRQTRRRLVRIRISHYAIQRRGFRAQRRRYIGMGKCGKSAAATAVGRRSSLSADHVQMPIRVRSTASCRYRDGRMLSWACSRI